MLIISISKFYISSQNFIIRLRQNKITLHFLIKLLFNNQSNRMLSEIFSTDRKLWTGSQCD